MHQSKQVWRSSCWGSSVPFGVSGTQAPSVLLIGHFSTQGTQGHSEGHHFFFFKDSQPENKDIELTEPGLELAPITSAPILLARA